MKRILLKFALTRPCKVIFEDGIPYLERYFLLNLFGLKLYLHRFVGSDPDRGLHNHPWKWAFSLVLFGQYLEERKHYSKWVKRFNFLTNKTFHRVHLIPKYFAGERNECWTLFMHPNNYKFNWGFMRDGNFIVWVPRNRDSNKNNWEKTAPKGGDFERDSDNIIIIKRIENVKS